MAWMVKTRGISFAKPYYLFWTPEEGAEDLLQTFRQRGGSILFFQSRDTAQAKADKLNSERNTPAHHVAGV